MTVLQTTPRQLGFTHESTSADVPVEWYTPPSIFKALALEFEVDVASPGRALVPWIPAAAHLTVREDGLKTTWRGRVWCNPPYGAQTAAWVQRFIQHRNGILLVFSRTDTAWFHKLVSASPLLLFIKGRISFIRGGSASARETAGAGCGSLLAAFGDDCRKALLRSDLGWLCESARLS